MPTSSTLQLNPKSGISNRFPPGQCTQYADDRYYQLTGYYVPWNGNAYQWLLGAMGSNWYTSNAAIKGIPAIIVLQPGVQGADPTNGHVGVVEKVNGDGTVYVSSLNWGLTPQARSQVSHQTFNAGQGVAFVWAIDQGFGGSTSSDNTLLSIAKTFSLAPNASVTAALVGIDEALKIVPIFDVNTAGMDDNIAGVVHFTDPVKWLGAVGNNVMIDFGAITIRFLLILLGLFLLYKVVSRFVDFAGVVDSTTGNAGKIIQALAPLAMVA